MKLSAMLDADETTIAAAGGDVRVSGVAYRSADVVAGDAFFCVPGFRFDGHDFAADAVARGAAALVVARPLPIEAPQVVVPDVRRALAVASARFFGEPTKRLSVAGVTGTNGKTTTVYLIESIMRAAGMRTGLIGTVETRIAQRRLDSIRTTPESADLQRLFAEMVDAGVTGVAMEVSSHALDLRRVDGVRFAVAAFTNLSQDHLDYHRTIDEYWAVKRALFTEMDVAERVVNTDDPYGAGLASEIAVGWTVGRNADAAVRSLGERPGATGTAFTLRTPGGDADVDLPLAGEYNVSNALVAAGCSLAIGIPLTAVVAGLQQVAQVPGRLERIEEGQSFTVLVDYAHTPDALAKAISAVRDVTPGKVIVVFGCGGDRDPDKRPLMGAVAGAAADKIILTSDNPRTEDPLGIIEQIERGVSSTSAEYSIEPDRHAAIRAAICVAEGGDTVLIAGKGHEDYQIFAEETVCFDDREVVREELRARC
jgi:UDP-N-acetylmuramoyl-L-alanyl-D-glutamate--2,6-diaminopimelate ligase